MRVAAASIAIALAFLLPTNVEARRSSSPMIEAINKVRRAHGLQPLRRSRSLCRSSSRFARHLVRTRRLAHGPRIMASRRFSELGEVLALTRARKGGRTPTLASWLRSPSHRAVLLRPTFRYVGAARARGRFGGGPAVVWTVQFGR